MVDYIILFLAWIIFFFLHSVLASSGSKEAFVKPGYISKRKYRLLYTLISTLAFSAILVLQLYLPTTFVADPSITLTIIGIVMAVYGILILKRSFQFIPLNGFLGLEEELAGNLITGGLHGKVRHPIYLGTIFLILGIVFLIPTDLMIVSALANFCYLPIGIMLEEEKLVKQYGIEYINYKKRTPSVFPRWRSLF